MTFQFYRCRFHFRSAGELYFAPFRSGNIVRGAFGSIFRKLACVPGCIDAKTCDRRATCPYARVFEPRAARGEGPSGIADWPRPFVFRASPLDGRTIPPGEAFHFDVHLFDANDPPLSHFALAFAELAREGIGPGRVRAELENVEQLDLDGKLITNGFQAAHPNAVHLERAPGPVRRVKVRFVTPVELKARGEVGQEPEFGVLLSRLRDRISTLRALYGPGPLEIDFKAMGDRAAHVRMTRCEVRRQDVERRSSRTGLQHPLGGFTGEAEYEGDLAEFLPYLHLGRWVGVGRQTVWGKGELDTAVL